MDSSKLTELRRQAANVYQSRTPTVRDASMYTYNLKAKAAAQQYSKSTLSQTQVNPNFIPGTNCCPAPASPGVNTYATSRLQAGSAGGCIPTYEAQTARAAGLAICCGPTPPPAEPLGIYYSTCCYDERLPSSLYNPPCTPGYNQTPHFVAECCPSTFLNTRVPPAPGC